MLVPLEKPFHTASQTHDIIPQVLAPVLEAFFKG